MTVPTSLHTSVVRMFTSDGLELHGLLFMPPDKRPEAGIVHIHGLAGNFYENRFIYVMAREAIARGMAFLAFNNRGHDYISDINKETDGIYDSISGGGAFEIVAECVHDIDAAIDVLLREGVATIFLQGHSSGANKAVFYLSQAKRSPVKGLVLISPCDDVALQHNATGDRAPQLLKLAQEMIADGKGMELMPEGSYFSYPMSAKTFFDYFGPESDQDVFPYRTPSSEFKRLASIDIPIFVTFGGKKDALLIPPGEAEAMLKSKATSSPSVVSAIIEGATHSYLNCEELLTEQVMLWIANVLRG